MWFIKILTWVSCLDWKIFHEIPCHRNEYFFFKTSQIQIPQHLWCQAYQRPWVVFNGVSQFYFFTLDLFSAILSFFALANTIDLSSAPAPCSQGWITQTWTSSSPSTLLTVQWGKWRKTTKKQKSPCGSCAVIRRRWVRVKRRGLLRTAACVPPEAGLIKDDQMWGGMLPASSFKFLTVTSKCLRKNLTGELALVSYSRSVS